MNKESIYSLVAGCVAAMMVLPAYGVDGVSAALGSGDDTDMARAGAQWDWQKTWFDQGDWRLGGYWDASVARWHAHSAAGDNQSLVEAGITPVFRLQRNVATGPVPYFEGAIGFHVLSRTHIDAKKHFSTHFQFGDHLGVGARFGPKRQYDIAYLFQHLSNGGIKNPNNGINFNEVRFSYHF